MAEVSLTAKVEQLHAALRRARLPHAFCGALALAYYEVPRATVDIDVNVFVSAERAARVASGLAPLGIDPAWADDPQVVDKGQVRTWWGRNPVDLFFAYDPFHDAMAKASRTVPFGETTIPILGAEHLLACKAIFDRRKDWIDIEQMLLVTDTLDVDEARRWVARIVGDDDQRLAHLDAVVQAVVGE